MTRGPVITGTATPKRSHSTAGGGAGGGGREGGGRGGLEENIKFGQFIAFYDADVKFCKCRHGKTTLKHLKIRQLLT